MSSYLCTLGYLWGKHLDSRGPKIDSTKARNELRKRKKLIGARFDTVLQVLSFGHPLIKVEKSTSSEVILCKTKVVGNFTY